MRAAEPEAALPDLADLRRPIVYFPVRHHSPACARLLRELALTLRPAAVLIEGPSDFNDRLDELRLPHQLPVAIYSYLARSNGRRQGAYHPFCVYSPEWQALQTAWELGVEARFIDLPWAEIAAAREPLTSRGSKNEPTQQHRYADAELRRSPYVEALCSRLGLTGFDDLWDTLFEIDGALTPQAYLERCHHFCFHARLLDDEVRGEDVAREAFMAQQIRAAAEAFGERGPLLVVSGGFHSFALFARVEGLAWAEGLGQPGGESVEDGGESVEVQSGPEHRGLALTPYSYERLDSLTGYDAGMPNPGFYHQVWRDRQGEGGARRLNYRRLLVQVARALRERGQAASAADLIAVETLARGLASLRGHAEVWRADLIDGITGALVKEELEQGCTHPMLEAIHAVFRGELRGQLAAGTSLPPLVHDVQRLLRDHALQVEPAGRELELELVRPDELTRSRILHMLRCLEIAGFTRSGGSDLALRGDLSRIWERWRLRWSPDFDATAIDAALYGPTLAEAAAARLQERAEGLERDAEQAALLLLDAALMGLTTQARSLLARLGQVIGGSGDFCAVTAALGHLLYLYRYDAVLGTAGQGELGALLAETFDRGLWLLEGLGQPGGGQDELVLRGIRQLVESHERCAEALGLDQQALVEVLTRTAAEGSQLPAVRGAATGALWTLGQRDDAHVQAQLRFFADPAQLGDFLSGLFCLAREAVQRQPELVRSLDETLMDYDDKQFLHALPALRLAFTYFTPREKHHLALTALSVVEPGGAGADAAGVDTAAPQPLELTVSVEAAVRAMALEAQLTAMLARYGLRGAAEGGAR